MTISCGISREAQEFSTKIHQLEQQVDLFNIEKQNMEQEINRVNAEKQNLEQLINHLNSEKQNIEQQLKELGLENINLGEQVDNLSKIINERTVENENLAKSFVILGVSVLGGLTVGFTSGYLIGRKRKSKYAERKE